MNPQIRAMTAADFDAVGDTTQAAGFGDRREFFRTALAALDRTATGEERRPLIEHHAGSGWLLEDATRLRGFLLPTHRGNGALIAGAADDALCLLSLHRHLTPADGHAWAGLPTENETGRRLLAEQSWFAWRTFPRMIRGDAPGWQPAMIWAQFNHAMG